MTLVMEELKNDIIVYIPIAKGWRRVRQPQIVHYRACGLETDNLENRATTNCSYQPV